MLRKLVYVRLPDTIVDTLSQAIYPLGFPPVFHFNQIRFFYQGYSYLGLVECKGTIGLCRIFALSSRQ